LNAPARSSLIDNGELALALRTISGMAQNEGIRFVSGFSGFRDQTVAELLQANEPG
jgi:hypothetical protein